MRTLETFNQRLLALWVFAFFSVVVYGNEPWQIREAYFKESPEMNQNRKWVGPFTNLNIKFIKGLDEDGEESFYVSGDNPAYIHIKGHEREYYFAGEMFDDNSMLCGDLKIYSPYGWIEQFGTFDNSGMHTVGIEIKHDYFINSHPQLIYKTRTERKCFDIISENSMYEIIDDLKKLEFEDKPKNIKPLSSSAKPRIYTKDYCIKIQKEKNGYSNFVTPPQPKRLTSGGKLLTAVAFLAAVGLAAKAISDDSKGSSSSSKSSSVSQPTNLYSLGNVEIVNWGTLGSLAISHAKVDLRNKNNYDVDVTISLYQDSWSLGSIVYSDYENSDRVTGVSDNYSRTIRVKANSMRSVYLRADHRGRPTHIRINSVR